MKIKTNVVVKMKQKVLVVVVVVFCFRMLRDFFCRLYFLHWISCVL